MRYLLLICTDEQSDLARGNEERFVMLDEYDQLIKELTADGKWLAGERLRPTFEATTVQVRDGKVLTSDGPFAETKEQMGGFFMVDVKDLDEAIEIASRLPSARNGSIEIRAVWEKREEQ
jgi:hypothetical protein